MYMGSQGRFGYNALVIFGYFGMVNISIFYLNYLFILPTFLNRKKYLSTALAMVTLAIAGSFIKCALAYYYYELIILREGKMAAVAFWDYFFTAMVISCFFIFLSTVLKFMADWFKNEKIKSTLENEKLHSELAFLKSQINPHFLFNSLNNIYSLAYQKSTKTPEAILKLSEIMRYMLYESNGNEVPLANEIRYLENYIELQKLRFKEDPNIQFEVRGDVSYLSIIPLVLISFVENAFKHGVATDKEHPIKIYLNAERGKLYFQLINKKSNLNKDETGGIGLQNVQRRLDLLYKGRYALNIENTNDLYTCELYLNLSDDTMPRS